MRKVSKTQAGVTLVSVLSFLALAAPVLAYDYGGQPNLDNSWKGLPVCAEAKPKAPILYEPNNPVLPQAKGAGRVRLQWTKVPGATGYNVYYGLTPKNYIYSAPNLGNGDTDNFTVGALGNRAYYFAVQTKGSCATSTTSNEWIGRPNGGGYSLVASGFRPVQTAPSYQQPENSFQPSTPPTENPSVNSGPSGGTLPVAPRTSAPAPKQSGGGLFGGIFSFFSKLFAF